MAKMNRIMLTLAVAIALAAVPAVVAQNSLVVTEDAGLNGTMFGLELRYEPGQLNLEYVQDTNPSNEIVYRAAWWMDVNSFAGVDPSRNFFFYTHGTNIASPDDPPLPVIRGLVFTKDVRRAIRFEAWDNQNNLRGTNSCMVPVSGEIQVEVNWTAGNVPNPGSLNYKIFEGGVMTCDMTVPGGIQNGFIDIDFQSLQTRPADGVTANSTLYVDEFESFRTLGAE